MIEGKFLYYFNDVINSPYFFNLPLRTSTSIPLHSVKQLYSYRGAAVGTIVKYVRVVVIENYY